MSNLGKGVLEICSNFKGKHPSRSVISIKVFCNFKFSCKFTAYFHKNTFRWLFLKRGIIPFYAFQTFLLFPSTTNLNSSSHLERRLCFQISVKSVNVVLKSGIVMAGTKNFILWRFCTSSYSRFTTSPWRSCNYQILI